MKKVSKNKRFSVVWQFAGKYFYLFIIAEICILVTYTVSLLLPLNLVRLVDDVLYGGDRALFGEVVLTYLLFFALSTVFNLIYSFTWQSLNNRYVVDVKNAVYEKVVYSKADFLSEMNVGDVMHRIDLDAEEFIHIIQRNIFHFVNSIFMCSAIVFIIWRINYIIALLLVAAALLPIIITRLFSKITERLMRESRDTSGVFTGKLFEILKGMREIRLLCAQWWAESNIVKPLKKLITLGNRIRRVDFTVDKAIYLINLITSIIIYSVSVTLIADERLTLGYFLASVQYIALLHRKFNWMLRIYLDWQGRKTSVDRVSELLNNEIEDDSGEAIEGAIESIEFRNVSFAYKEVQVLNKLSFKINKGEKIALVGTSGVGKTTVIGLLLKLYKPCGGEILINGINIENIMFSDIRRRIGVVQQDILLFDESIRYNLLLGNEDVSDEELLNVCERVGLRELIEAFPEGLDTKIGSNDRGLSGGQKQRVMIARTMLKKSELFIFDEATSALDVETEKMITEDIKNIGGVTTIVISHRLAAIKNCNKVIVIKDGEVEEIGEHGELLQSSPSYREMFGGGAA